MAEKQRWQTEGVRENGTLEGGFGGIETHVLPPEACLVQPGADGYVRVIGSFMDIMVEMRVPLTLCEKAVKLTGATPDPQPADD